MKHIIRKATAISSGGFRSRTVFFYRDYIRLFGGHVKHSHYFDHVLRTPGFARKIVFSDQPLEASQALERSALWPGDEAERFEPDARDVFFLEGIDWLYLIENGLDSLPNPKINLIQNFLHARQDTERYRFLAYRAIRICVSQEVNDAISATGRVNGPIITIPNGTDVTPVKPERDLAVFMARPRPVTIVGYKRPELALALSRSLNEKQIAHPPATEKIERRRFIDRLVESRIAVCLPHPEEGFYLPALEAMSAGCIVVTLDCTGNRGFCRHEENCFIAESCIDSLLDMVNRALSMSACDYEKMTLAARNTITEHSLDTERKRFQAVLANVDQLYERP